MRPRDRCTPYLTATWIPAFAGMTKKGGMTNGAPQPMDSSPPLTHTEATLS
jgi:hypothetical protein